MAYILYVNQIIAANCGCIQSDAGGHRIRRLRPTNVMPETQDQVFSRSTTSSIICIVCEQEGSALTANLDTPNSATCRNSKDGKLESLLQGYGQRGQRTGSSRPDPRRLIFQIQRAIHIGVCAMFMHRGISNNRTSSKIEYSAFGGPKAD